MKFPVINKSSWFYKNCKTQRKKNAKICQVCPFRNGIEKQEGITGDFRILNELEQIVKGKR